MWKEFEKFILRGNVVDMAVGIIIGAAFTTVVKSLVDDIIMPPIGYVLHGLDFSHWYFNLGHEQYATLAEAQEAGASTINIGLFVNNVLSLIIVGLVVFYLVKGYNRLHDMLEHRGEEELPPEAPTTKTCPECLSEIPAKAARCAFCTTRLEVELEAGTGQGEAVVAG
ncbi:MAG: large conductance mechanosensitive channel protein MscL [Anaerolineae bacterium]|nr:large conductance mechanosensitive channel protein MscL [Anaerolineae bacterium]